MENGDIPARGLYAFLPGQLPQGVHNMRDVNIIGAPGAAGFAGGTDPDGIAVQYLLHQAQVEKAYGPVGHDVHSEGHRAAVGAFLALETGRYLLPAEFLYFTAQRWPGHHILR